MLLIGLEIAYGMSIVEFLLLHFLSIQYFFRQKMAKFAWQMGSEPITSAVAASKIYGSMAQNFHGNQSEKEKVLGFKEWVLKTSSDTYDVI